MPLRQQLYVGFAGSGAGDAFVEEEDIFAEQDTGRARVAARWRGFPYIFPASGGDDVHVYKACFWHYQFATTPKTRGWLYERAQEDWCDADLTDRHINWVASQSEEQNQTTLMKWSDTPAPGGWKIRTGNYVTLAELFYFGCFISNCTCFELYRLYLSLPIFIHKRAHSTSHTAEAQRRRNAKTLHYQEYGTWGLPKW